MSKRNLANELVSGIKEMQKHDAGKLTLRTHKVESNPLPELSPKQIKAVREELSCSRSVFAHYLRVQPRTLEKWEQGISKPNDQAKTLLLLVKKNPEILKQIAEI
jgi:putative transcriptional regulator